MRNTLILLLTLFSFAALAQTERLNGQVSQGLVQPTGTAIVADPGFEGGTPNAFWTEFSSTFGTPICDVGACGTGTGTGPNNGSFWTWFGGITGIVEEGSVSQTVTIPAAGSVDLSFFLEAPVCNGTGFMEVLIDGNQEYLFDQTNPDCGVLGYSQVNVDLTAYQGQTVDLEFHSITQGDANVNIFIDDVDIVTSGAPGGPVTAVPTLQWLGIGLMLLVLGFFGVRRLNQ